MVIPKSLGTAGLEWPLKHWRDRAEILHSLHTIHPMHNLWYFLPGPVRSRNYYVIRGKASYPFFNAVFSANLLVAIDRDGDIMRDLGQKTYI